MCGEAARFPDPQTIVSELLLHGEEEVEIRFRAEASLLGKPMFRNAIRAVCDYHRIELHMREYGGLLSSEFVVEMSGPSNRMANVLASLPQPV